MLRQISRFNIYFNFSSERQHSCWHVSPQISMQWKFYYAMGHQLKSLTRYYNKILVLNTSFGASDSYRYNMQQRGQSALSHAIGKDEKSNRSRIITLLLQRGAQPNRLTLEVLRSTTFWNDLTIRMVSYRVMESHRCCLQFSVEILRSFLHCLQAV